jgi:hypothetical protein
MRFPVVGVIAVTLALVTNTSAVPFRADYLINSIAQGEGTRLTGSTTSEYMGMSVSGGGDVDGDGVADFLGGAWHVKSLSGGSTEAGHAYVLYGVTDPSNAAATWPTDSKIKAIAQNNTKGRIIDGVNAYTNLGQIVAIVGDVNGDRLDDIVVGSDARDG